MNPIDRFIRDHKLSINSLAGLAGVTPQVVRRTMQGLFHSIPPALLDAMRSLEPMKDFEHAYAAFTEEIHVDLPTSGFDTWIEWRRSIAPSLLAFCKHFKIQPTIIDNYEKGRTEELPHFLYKKLVRLAGEDYAERIAKLPRN